MVAVGNPDRSNVEAMVFSWLDTREKFFADAGAYAILDDYSQVPVNVDLALKSFDVRPVLWSELLRGEADFLD